jgi:hypothetical protein
MSTPEPVYEATFVVEDPRYPMMVLKINGQPIGGYYLNLDTLNFDNRVCVCNARETSECICGVWDND